MGINDLFQPVQLGDLTLANRMVMAPMTRNRARCTWQRAVYDGNLLSTTLQRWSHHQ